MYYEEPLNEQEYKQGLEVGDVATFNQTGDKYALPGGWEVIKVVARVTGFDYPSILTDKGGWHYTRYDASVPVQKSLNL
jgi:hypothetical protein